MKTSIVKLLSAALVLLPVAARADIAPPPGAEEAWRRELILKAGYSCGEPVVLKPGTTEQQARFREKGLVPVLAQCANGKTYLVATPPRRRPGPGAANAGPAPEPVVLPMQ